MADASGVVPGQNEVRIAGMPVWRITGSDIVDGRAVLTLSIDPQHGQIYRDARLRLRPSTPLDMYLDVVKRGTPRAGAATSKEILPASATSVPVQFAQALNIFRPLMRARMQRFISQFGPALVDNGDDLRAAFVQITPFLSAEQDLTSALAKRRTPTRRLVHNLRTMMDALAERDEALRGMVAAGADTMTALGTTAPELDRTLAELPGFVDQARGTFGVLPGELARARRAFTALRPVADIRPSSLSALEAFSDDARHALSRLQPTVRSLNPLFDRARPLSSRLAGAFEQLRPSPPRLDKVTRDRWVRDDERPVLPGHLVRREVHLRDVREAVRERRLL